MANIRKDQIKKMILVITYIALLFPFFSYNLIKSQTIVQGMKVVCLSIFTCMYIMHARIIDEFDLWNILGVICICCISIINGTFGISVLFATLVLSIIPLMIRKLLKKSILILQALYIIAFVLIVANAITMIGNVNSDSTFLLGGKNALAIAILPLISVIGTYSLKKYDKITIKNYIVIMIGIISIVLGESSTGMIIAVMMFIYTLAYKKIKLTPKVLITIYSIILFMVLGTNILTRIDIVNDIIVNVFNKDFTFSGRTYIWDIAINAFVESPILGYGKGNLVIYNLYNNIISEAHNFILEILLAGGIIYLFIILKTIFVGIKKQDEKNIIYNWNIAILFLYLFIGLTESVAFKLEFWIILALAASSKIIEKEKKE